LRVPEQEHFFEFEEQTVSLSKGNSVQEAYAKCFAVHILKFEMKK
jgi:hypothetical protein